MITVPVVFTKSTEEQDSGEPFKLAAGTKCSWLKADETLGPEKLRPRIEPWLTALFQSEHLALLLGSGLSHAVHGIATGKVLPGMSQVKFTHFDTEIIAEAEKTAGPCWP